MPRATSCAVQQMDAMSGGLVCRAMPSASFVLNRPRSVASCREAAGTSGPDYIMWAGLPIGITGREEACKQGYVTAKVLLPAVVVSHDLQAWVIAVLQQQQPGLRRVKSKLLVEISLSF